MTDTNDLNRYKGLFIKGLPKKVIRPKKNDLVFHNGKIEINCAGFNSNGWMPPKKGAM